MQAVFRFLLRFGWKNPWLALLAVGVTRWLQARRAATREERTAGRPIRRAVDRLIHGATTGALMLVAGASGTRFMTVFLHEAATALVITPVKPAYSWFKAFLKLLPFKYLSGTIPFSLFG